MHSRGALEDEKERKMVVVRGAWWGADAALFFSPFLSFL